MTTTESSAAHRAGAGGLSLWDWLPIAHFEWQRRVTRDRSIEARRAAQAWRALQQRAREEFARQSGWVIGRSFSVRQLAQGRAVSRRGDYPENLPRTVFDHCEF